jgi:hypothetical protein
VLKSLVRESKGVVGAVALLASTGCSATDSKTAEVRWEPRRYVFSGRVTDEAGKPLEGVVLYHSCGGAGSKPHRADLAITGSNGTYEGVIPRDERGDLVLDDGFGPHGVGAVLFELTGFKTESAQALMVPRTMVLRRY